MDDEVLSYKDVETHNWSFAAGETITKTRPCDVYLLERHFYIAKLGYAGVYLFFLFLLQKHRLWVPTIYVLSINKKNIKICELKIFNFLSTKNLCLLHGQVFVMLTNCGLKFDQCFRVMKTKNDD